MKKLDKKNMTLYILMLLLLFGIPIYTIIVSTDTLKGGKEFLFKVEAFDPYDMFRGNYLAIEFKERKVKSVEDLKASRGECAYVMINEDGNGFAYFSDIVLEKPVKGSDYYKTKIGYCSENYDSDRLYEYTIDTPTRYYMNENKSLAAENLYNENIKNTYVKVRVKDGKMVIVGVYINDVLIDSIS